MSAKQFVEWQAYYQVEPFGPPSGYWQAGLIASTLANVNRTKKRQKALTPEDFMPRTLVQGEADEPVDVGAQTVQAFQMMAEQQKASGRGRCE
jgi:hypothetical protein